MKLITRLDSFLNLLGDVFRTICGRLSRKEEAEQAVISQIVANGGKVAVRILAKRLGIAKARSEKARIGVYNTLAHLGFRGNVLKNPSRIRIAAV